MANSILDLLNLTSSGGLTQSQINVSIMEKIAAAIATNDIAAGEHVHNIDEITDDGFDPVQSYQVALEGTP